jgi:hypothetical protein
MCYTAKKSWQKNTQSSLKHINKLPNKRQLQVNRSNNLWSSKNKSWNLKKKEKSKSCKKAKLDAAKKPILKLDQILPQAVTIQKKTVAIENKPQLTLQMNRNIGNLIYL